jgi:hypothetical protein
MNYFKITIGLILAFVVCAIPVFVYAYMHMENEPDYTAITDIITCATAAFVFLSSIFVPSARKATAITALIICCIFDLQRLLSVIGSRNNNIAIVYMIPAGALVGLLISFLTFKNKDWNSPANQ